MRPDGASVLVGGRDCRGRMLSLLIIQFDKESMKKIVKEFSISFMTFGLIWVSALAWSIPSSAQLLIKVRNAVVKIDSSTAPEVRQKVIKSIVSEGGRLLPPSSKKKNRGGRVLQLNNKSLRVPQGGLRLAKVSSSSYPTTRSNPTTRSSRSTKSLQLTYDVVNEILTLGASGDYGLAGSEITVSPDGAGTQGSLDQSFGETSLESAENLVTIFKAFNYDTCSSDEAAIAAIDGDLTRRGVKLVNSSCAVVSGTSLVADCSIVRGYRIHVINRSQIVWAVLAGFSPIEWISDSITPSQCSPPAERFTIEMVGTISNLTCVSTQNTVEDFDKKLSAGGLSIIQASCGTSNVRILPVCGIYDTFYRLVKIPKAQRELALDLGLSDKSDFNFLVTFGQECPSPVFLDPPKGWTEMVGLLPNPSCAPQASLIEAFDRILREAQIPVLHSGCGYSNFPSGGACREIYRLVTIPESFEEVAEIVFGLRKRESISSTVSFGLSCL